MLYSTPLSSFISDSFVSHQLSHHLLFSRPHLILHSPLNWSYSSTCHLLVSVSFKTQNVSPWPIFSSFVCSHQPLSVRLVFWANVCHLILISLISPHSSSLCLRVSLHQLLLTGTHLHSQHFNVCGATYILDEAIRHIDLIRYCVIMIVILFYDTLQSVYGDIADRIQLRSKLQCESFQWYLKNVFPELFIPNDALAFGEVR